MNSQTQKLNVESQVDMITEENSNGMIAYVTMPASWKDNPKQVAKIKKDLEKHASSSAAKRGRKIGGTKIIADEVISDVPIPGLKEIPPVRFSRDEIVLGCLKILFGFCTASLPGFPQSEIARNMYAALNKKSLNPVDKKLYFHMPLDHPDSNVAQINLNGYPERHGQPFHLLYQIVHDDHFEVGVSIFEKYKIWIHLQPSKSYVVERSHKNVMGNYSRINAKTKTIENGFLISK